MDADTNICAVILNYNDAQTTMKLTITLMFSGIFLALTAMSKKHKDEES